ncbi:MULTISPECIES: VOC family protein [unclassified Streptomyces]|uniref:VOC family protein n=1 Tax=unclassified Streptomyces TaxID=2593676 RepID=UPI0034407BE5
MKPAVSPVRRCSHVLIRVDDLRQTVRDYRALGFEVHYATAEHKARHAHVWFPEGPIIELLATPANARYFKLPLTLIGGMGAGERMVRWSREPEGFVDVALVTEGPDIRVHLAELRGAGVPFGRAVPWKRTPPGGPLTRFRFAYPRRDRLPFLVTPYDPPLHPAKSHHTNGAERLTGVVLGVRPEDRAAVERIVAADPAFELETAEVTGVRAIRISGLTEDPDPALLHGARVLAAPL